ncbi:MAG: hypothetical protein K6U74_02410 [Firmicutes bacterium]|nr:hypothetical protein [Bacillota bacterium]
MRKIPALFVFLFVFFGLLMLPAFSNQPVKIFVNGTQVYSDVAPFILDGRVMVPLRFVSEALGCDVSWDSNGWAVYVDNENAKERWRNEGYTKGYNESADANYRGGYDQGYRKGYEAGYNDALKKMSTLPSPAQSSAPSSPTPPSSSQDSSNQIADEIIKKAGSAKDSAKEAYRKLYNQIPGAREIAPSPDSFASQLEDRSRVPDWGSTGFFEACREITADSEQWLKEKNISEIKKAGVKGAVKTLHYTYRCMGIPDDIAQAMTWAVVRGSLTLLGW